jgi:CheY-like chemotaxis protein
MYLDGAHPVNDVPFSGQILVVDDDDLNLDILARRLARDGHRVTTASNGFDALDKMRMQAFDLLLLDIMMPKMNGYQVLEAMRDDKSLRHTPVIVISAVNDMSSVVKCVKLGATDYLFKPFDPVLLHARVGACLEKKRLLDQERHYLRQIEQEKKQVHDLLNLVIPIGIELTHEQNFTNLLEKILMGGKMLCNADGATLYLRTDANTLEYVIVSNESLGIMLTLGDDKPTRFAPIRLYADDGAPADNEFAAAHATVHGEPINVENERDLDRFPGTKAFDTQAGYKTISLLTLPLVSSDQQVIGVLQYANARDAATGEIIPFSSNLQPLMEALASLAAAALEGYVREATLQQTIQELRISVSVDERARQVQVNKITDTDFFLRLRSRIHEFRSERQ